MDKENRFRHLLLTRLDITFKGNVTKNNMVEHRLRVPKFRATLDEVLEYHIKVLEEGQFLFLTDLDYGHFEYKGVVYDNFKKWGTDLRIVFSELFRDIVESDGHISACIIRNESNPEYNFYLEFTYNRQAYTSVLVATEQYGVNHSNVRDLMRKGFTVQDAIDYELKYKEQEEELNTIHIEGYGKCRWSELYDLLGIDNRDVSVLKESYSTTYSEFNKNIEDYIFLYKGVPTVGAYYLKEVTGLYTNAIWKIIRERMTGNDALERGLSVEREINYLKDILYYRGETHNSIKELLNYYHASAFKPKMDVLYEESRSIEDIHDAIDKYLRVRDNLEIFADAYGGKVVGAKTTKEAIASIAEVHAVKPHNIEAIFAMAGREAKEFLDIVDVEIEKVHAANSYRKRYKEFLVERDIMPRLLNVLSQKSGISVEELVTNTDNYISFYEGKDYLFPIDLQDDFGFSSRLASDIALEVIKIVDNAERDEYLAREIEYHLELFQYKGVRYDTLTELLDSCSTNKLKVKKLYSQRLPVSEIHAQLK